MLNQKLMITPYRLEFLDGSSWIQIGNYQSEKIALEAFEREKALDRVAGITNRPYRLIFECIQRLA